MADLSRRGFGSSVLAVLSAGCLGTRPRQDDEVTPVPDPTRTADRDQSVAATAEPTDVEPVAETPSATSSLQPNGSEGNSARIQVENASRSSTPDPETRSVDTRFRLEAEEYQDFSIDAGDRTVLTYDLIVRRGPPVDVILFTEEEYEAFQNRHRARYLGEVSKFHSVNINDQRITIPAETYRLVVNNTSWSRAIPSPRPPYDRVEGECVVDFEFSTTVTTDG